MGDDPRGIRIAGSNRILFKIFILEDKYFYGYINHGVFTKCLSFKMLSTYGMQVTELKKFARLVA